MSAHVCALWPRCDLAYFISLGVLVLLLGDHSCGSNDDVITTNGDFKRGERILVDAIGLLYVESRTVDFRMTMGVAENPRQVCASSEVRVQCAKC